MRLLLTPITGSVRLLWRAVVLPVKVLFSTADLTFRAGVKVGSLPVRGGAAVSRALGWKLVTALGVGVVIGFVIGREFAHWGHGHDHHDHDHHHHEHDHEPVLEATSSIDGDPATVA